MRKGKQAVLSISYGDYLQDFGGTNKVIAAHQKMINDAGIKYIYIFPVLKFKSINDEMWYLVDDGIFKGTKTTEGVLVYLQNLENQGCLLSNIFLHHLLNINTNALTKILNVINVPIIFYIHDYYSICIQYNLLENGKDFCGGERCNKNKCNNCENYKAAMQHVMKVDDIFDKIEDRLIVIAPSDVAKEIWCTSFPNLREQVNVIYHQTLHGEYCGNLNNLSNSEKIRIAFVGDTRENKGWGIWMEMFSKLDEDVKAKYEFYVFGTMRTKIPEIKEVKVKVVKNLNAMVEALRKYRVSVAYLGSIWPETYSYTYYEALASNAFVLTNAKSGNIAAQVQQRKNGIVFNGVDELIDIVTDAEGLKKSINSYKEMGVRGPLDMMENDAILKMLIPKECKNEISSMDLTNKKTVGTVLANLDYIIYKFGKKIKAALRGILKR